MWRLPVLSQSLELANFDLRFSGFDVSVVAYADFFWLPVCFGLCDKFFDESLINAWARG